MKTILMMITLLTPSGDELTVARHFDTMQACAEREVQLSSAPYIKSVKCFDMDRELRTRPRG